MITLPIGQPTLLFFPHSADGNFVDFVVNASCVCKHYICTERKNKEGNDDIIFASANRKWSRADMERWREAKKGERQQRFSLVVIVKCHKHLWSRFFSPSNPSIIFHEKKVHMFWKPGKKRKLVIGDADDARNGEDWSRKKRVPQARTLRV